MFKFYFMHWLKHLFESQASIEKKRKTESLIHPW